MVIVMANGNGIGHSDVWDVVICVFLCLSHRAIGLALLESWPPHQMINKCIHEFVIDTKRNKAKSLLSSVHLALDN